MEVICSCGGEEVEGNQSPLCKCQKWGGGLMTLLNHTFYPGPSTYPATQMSFSEVSVCLPQLLRQ